MWTVDYGTYWACAKMSSFSLLDWPCGEGIHRQTLPPVLHIVPGDAPEGPRHTVHGHPGQTDGSAHEYTNRLGQGHADVHNNEGWDGGTWTPQRVDKNHVGMRENLKYHGVSLLYGCWCWFKCYVWDPKNLGVDPPLFVAKIKKNKVTNHRIRGVFSNMLRQTCLLCSKNSP